MIYNFLFPRKLNDPKVSLLLLVARILFGLMLMRHGIEKVSNFSELSSTFPDPLGLGSSVSLSLAIFGELICSLGFIFGFLYRLAMIPMIFTMCMVFFVIHSKDPFAVKELALMYLLVFTLLYITGPGKYSIDNFLAEKIIKKR